MLDHLGGGYDNSHLLSWKMLAHARCWTPVLSPLSVLAPQLRTRAGSV